MARNTAKESLIYSLALEVGFPKEVALIVVAHARHETGDFTSNYFKNYNNAFGYNYVKGAALQIGKTNTIEDGAPKARYATVRNSVLELFNWWQRRMKENKFGFSDISTPQAYVQRLQKYGYFRASISTYSGAVTKYYGQMSNVLPAVVVTTTNDVFIVLVMLAGYLYFS